MARGFARSTRSILVRFFLASSRLLVVPILSLHFLLTDRRFSILYDRHAFLSEKVDERYVVFHLPPCIALQELLLLRYEAPIPRKVPAGIAFLKPCNEEAGMK